MVVGELWVNATLEGVVLLELEYCYLQSLFLPFKVVHFWLFVHYGLGGGIFLEYIIHVYIISLDLKFAYAYSI